MMAASYSDVDRIYMILLVKLGESMTKSLIDALANDPQLSRTKNGSLNETLKRLRAKVGI